MTSKNFVSKVTREEFQKLQPRCNCPCNELLEWKDHYRINGIPKYKHGHNKPTKGKKLSEEVCKHISEGHKGQTAWNKGKKMPEETCKKMSENDKGRVPWNKGKKGSVPWNKGLKGAMPEPWNKGVEMSIEYKEKCRQRQKGKPSCMKGKKHKEESKQKMSKYWKEALNNPENHPNWQGGTSFEPYCKLFNNILKEAVRERDSRLCQLCCKTEDENGEKQTVHHIHYDKKNCEPDLITLCSICNKKANGNREYYEKLFMNMLNNRELLFWTREYFKNKNVFYLFRLLFQ